MFSKLTAGKWGKALKIVAISAVLTTLLAACGKDEIDPTLTFKGTENGTVIATYKDGSVTDQEYDKFKAGISLLQGIDESILDLEGYREAFLKQYISYKILAHSASAEDQEAAKEEALTSYEQTKKALEQYGDVKDMLKERNLTQDDLASLILIAITADKYIQSQITDDMLKAEYDENKADYTLYSGRQIVVKTSVTDTTTGEATVTRTNEEALARAKEVQEKLVAGGSWDELAKQYSDDTATNASGGVFTDYMGGYWVQTVKDAAFTLPLNEVSEPLETSVGYSVIMIEKRDVLEYDALAETTLAMVRNVVANDINTDFIENTLPTYDVEINFPASEDETSATAEPTTEPSAEPTATDDAGAETE